MFMEFQKLNGCQVRWCIYLFVFDFIIQYQAEKKNPVDMLSRQPDYQGNELANSQFLSILQNKMAIVQHVGIRFVGVKGKSHRVYIDKV